MRLLTALLSLLILCCTIPVQAASSEEPPVWSGRVAATGDHQVTVLRHGRQMSMKFERDVETAIVGERVMVFPFASEEELVIGQICLVEGDPYDDPLYQPIGTVWYYDWIVDQGPDFVYVCYCHELGCDGCNRHYYGRPLVGRCECLTCERHPRFEFSISIHVGRSWPSIAWNPIPPRPPISWHPNRHPMPPRIPDHRPPMPPRGPNFGPPEAPHHPGMRPPTRPPLGPPGPPDYRPPMPPRRPDVRPPTLPRRPDVRPPTQPRRDGPPAVGAPQPPRTERPPMARPQEPKHGIVAPGPAGHGRRNGRR